MRGITKNLADPGEKVDALWAMVATSAERAEAMLRAMPGNVSVTMDVSPSQIFIGGEIAAVRAALEKFKEAGIWGQALPVFPLLMPYLTVHTERAAPFEAKLRAIVGLIPLGSGKYTVYSGTTATPYPRAPEAIREMMLSAVTRPVKIRDTIARLYADGVRIFVQLGAGGKMQANVENTLAGSDYVSLSSDVTHRGGLEQLHRSARATRSSWGGLSKPACSITIGSCCRSIRQTREQRPRRDASSRSSRRVCNCRWRQRSGCAPNMLRLRLLRSHSR